MFSMVTLAMPADLYDPFLETGSGDGWQFVRSLETGFDTETYPSWLAQLPDTAQTYFITRWMSAVLASTDLLGSSSISAKALVLTKGSDGITATVTGSYTFA